MTVEEELAQVEDVLARIQAVANEVDALASAAEPLQIALGLRSAPSASEEPRPNADDAMAEMQAILAMSEGDRNYANDLLRRAASDYPNHPKEWIKDVRSFLKWGSPNPQVGITHVPAAVDGPSEERPHPKCPATYPHEAHVLRGEWGTPWCSGVKSDDDVGTDERLWQIRERVSSDKAMEETYGHCRHERRVMEDMNYLLDRVDAATPSAGEDWRAVAEALYERLSWINQQGDAARAFSALNAPYTKEAMDLYARAQDAMAAPSNTREHDDAR